jgi:hypothetical protein
MELQTMLSVYLGKERLQSTEVKIHQINPIRSLDIHTARQYSSSPEAKQGAILRSRPMFRGDSSVYLIVFIELGYHLKTSDRS